MKLTNSAASSALLIIGQMIPIAPASSAFITMPGSRHGTRAIGTTPEPRIA